MKKIILITSLLLFSVQAKADNITSGIPLVISAGKIKKDQAYHTCRHEVIGILKSLEEFNGIRAKVISAKIRKKGDTSFVNCSFSGLVGKRGTLRFPVKKVSFKYRNKAHDFIIDSIKSDDWPVHIGISH